MTAPAERLPRRAVLARIVLATDLPVPYEVHFHPGGDTILSVSCDRLADGQAWVAFFGGRTDTYVNTDGNRYLRNGSVFWEGWSVQVFACEPVAPTADLDEDTRARLGEIAEGTDQ